MTRYRVALSCSLVLSLAWVTAAAHAQNSPRAPEAYVEAAKASVAPKTAGYPPWQAFDDSYARMCNSPSNPIPQPPPTMGGTGGTRNPSVPRSYW